MEHTFKFYIWKKHIKRFLCDFNLYVHVILVKWKIREKILQNYNLITKYLLCV